MSRILHFTLGPVQGFIGSARRTRDFWAGSFLLSLLSGVAMRAVTRAGGTILFPQVEGDPLYSALDHGGDGPVVGSLPNRFKARVPEGFDPEMAANAVRKRWRKIADAVRREILGDVLDDASTRIWERQISRFWEIAWVLGGEPKDRSDGAWLEARKSWRCHEHEIEPGDHCVLMSELQELSGVTRATQRAQQDEFWENVREAVGTYTDRKREIYDSLELRPSERLCAVALVKRLFPLLQRQALEEALGFFPRREGGGGIESWPSLAAVAALPWMQAAWRHPEPCRKFASAARKVEEAVVGGQVLTIAERESPICWLQKLRDSGGGDFAKLDGKLFFDFTLAADEGSARAELERVADPRTRMTADFRKQIRLRAEKELELKPRLLQALRDFRRDLKAAGSRLGEPSPFLALLRMDGDGIGTILSSGKVEEAKVSAALDAFTAKATEIVRQADGVLIYAGGDDVLAFLPLTTALQTALDLRRAYGKAWHDHAGGFPATISAGLAFAHFGVPFTSIVEESRRLLEDFAKDENGRDSIAVSVLKPSGKAVEWCTIFEQLAASSQGDEPFVSLIERFGKVGERFTTFAYNMRERYEELLKEQGSELVDKLFLAEWLKGRDAAKLDLGEERAKVRALLGVCRTCRRHAGEGPDDPVTHGEKPVTLEGALLLKFLIDNLPAPPGAAS